jgi:hypothetical protein
MLLNWFWQTKNEDCVVLVLQNCDLNYFIATTLISTLALSGKRDT